MAEIKRTKVMWSYPELRMEITRAKNTALFLNEYGVANRLDDLLDLMKKRGHEEYT